MTEFHHGTSNRQKWISWAIRPRSGCRSSNTTTCSSHEDINAQHATHRNNAYLPPLKPIKPHTDIKIQQCKPPSNIWDTGPQFTASINGCASTTLRCGKKACAQNSVSSPPVSVPTSPSGGKSSTIFWATTKSHQISPLSHSPGN